MPKKNDSVVAVANPQISEPWLQYDNPDIGKVCYEGFCRACGGVSVVNQKPLPAWDLMSDDLKACWRAAGEAVLEHKNVIE